VIQVLKPHTTCHCRCIRRKVCLILQAFPKNFLQTNLNLSHIQIQSQLFIHSQKTSLTSFPWRGCSNYAAFRKIVTRKVGAITTIPLLISTQGFSSIVEFVRKLVFQAGFFFLLLLPVLYLSGRGTSHITL